jgi:hypothetical protein
MAISAIVEAVSDNSGYLQTSHKKMHDYQTTKVGGVTNILDLQAENKTAFGDWRDDFFTKGYTVVKGAIPRERAIAYRDKAMDWFSKFEFGLDLNDKSTWTEEHLPVMMNGGMVMNYCAAHEKWVWEARWYVNPHIMLLITLIFLL